MHVQVNLVATQLVLDREHTNRLVFVDGQGLDPNMDLKFRGPNLRALIQGPASSWQSHLTLTPTGGSGGLSCSPNPCYYSKEVDIINVIKQIPILPCTGVKMTHSNNRHGCQILWLNHFMHVCQCAHFVDKNTYTGDAAGPVCIVVQCCWAAYTQTCTCGDASCCKAPWQVIYVDSIKISSRH